MLRMKCGINFKIVDQQKGDHFLLQEEENAVSAMLSSIYFDLINILCSNQSWMQATFPAPLYT